MAERQVGGAVVGGSQRDTTDGTGEVPLHELVNLMSAVKTHADARYDVMSEQLAELAARIHRLDGGGSSAAGAEDKEVDSARRRPWSARATREQWQELVEWVDWMQRAYSLAGRTLDPVPSCWPAHQSVVEELAALHASWRAAMAEDADDNNATDAALYWHDRWLWPTRERLSASFLGRCRNGNHELTKPPARTNQDFIPGRGAPSDPANQP